MGTFLFSFHFIWRPTDRPLICREPTTTTTTVEEELICKALLIFSVSLKLKYFKVRQPHIQKKQKQAASSLAMCGIIWRQAGRQTDRQFNGRQIIIFLIHWNRSRRRMRLKNIITYLSAAPATNEDEDAPIDWKRIMGPWLCSSSITIYIIILIIV